MTFLLSPSFADTTSAHTLFYCKTTKGKQIKVEKTKSYFSYSFGRDLKKPEIVLRKKPDEAYVYCGAYKDGNVLTIEIPNGQYSYIINSGHTGKGKFSYLTVSKNGNEIAELVCKDSTVYTGL